MAPKAQTKVAAEPAGNKQQTMDSTWISVDDTPHAESAANTDKEGLPPGIKTLKMWGRTVITWGTAARNITYAQVVEAAAAKRNDQVGRYAKWVLAQSNTPHPVLRLRLNSFAGLRQCLRRGARWQLGLLRFPWEATHYANPGRPPPQGAPPHMHVQDPGCGLEWDSRGSTAIPASAALGGVHLHASACQKTVPAIKRAMPVRDHAPSATQICLVLRRSMDHACDLKWLCELPHSIKLKWVARACEVRPCPPMRPAAPPAAAGG